MQTIYIDILIILNIYVNYFLLKTTAKLTHSPLKFRRCFIASAYGSLFSLIILLPHINTVLNLLIKLIAAVTIVALAFGIHEISRLITNSIAFFASNFIFAGVIYAVYIWLEPDFMHFNNSYLYVDFSLTVLVFTTAALYFIFCAARYFLDKTPVEYGCYKIIIRFRDRIVSLSGLADTGNSLVDFFSGKPVIICSKSNFSDITGFEENFCSLPKGFRFIPCSTASGNGIIPIFNPDEVIIVNEKNGTRKPVDAMVGFGNDCEKAIFNPKFLKL